MIELRPSVNVISDAMHSYPRASNVFEDSIGYRIGLIFESIKPHLLLLPCILLLLLRMLVIAPYRMLQKNRDRCSCSMAWRIRSCVVFITLALALALYFEMKLHLAVLKALQRFRSTLFESGEFEECQRNSNFELSNLVKDVNPYYLRQVHRAPGPYVESIKNARIGSAIYRREMLYLYKLVKNLQSPLVGPIHYQHPLKQSLSMLEWLRFMLCTTCWSTMTFVSLVRIINVNEHGVPCSCCGLMFCVMMAVFVLSMSLGLADACQNPLKAVREMTGFFPMFEEAYYRYQCRKWRHQLYYHYWLLAKAPNDTIQMIALREVHLSAAVPLTAYYSTDANYPYFNMPVPGGIYSGWADDASKVLAGADLKLRGFMAGVIDKCKFDCEAPFEPEKHLVMHSVSSLCEGDFVIKWLFYQLIAVVVAELLFLLSFALYTFNF